jgi:hypothetical protein
MNTFLTTKTTEINHEIANMMEFESSRIKQNAYTKGKTGAMKDVPQPFAKSDKLIHHTGDIKADCEQVALKLLHKIMPSAHVNEGRIDTGHAEMHNTRLMDEINKVKNQINILRHELGDFDPRGLASRIWVANFVCGVLFVGEVALNTQAFQITGDNLLFSLIISGSVSLAVCLGAHVAGRKYKDAKTKAERRVIIIVSAIGITVVSGVIAVLRSIYFQRIGLDVNPLYFTIFNIVFFLIAAIATWYIHPTKQEVEQNREQLQKLKRINKLETDYKQQLSEQREHEEKTKEGLKQNLRAILQAEYCIQRVRKLHKEAVEIFKYVIHQQFQSCRVRCPLPKEKQEQHIHISFLLYLCPVLLKNLHFFFL